MKALPSGDVGPITVRTVVSLTFHMGAVVAMRRVRLTLEVLAEDLSWWYDDPMSTPMTRRLALQGLVHQMLKPSHGVLIENMDEIDWRLHGHREAP